MVVLAFVVAACSGGGSGGGDSLRYGYDLGAQFTNTFDIAASNGACDQVPLFFIYDTLTHFDPDTGEITPGLAESWKLDGRTFTITLRPDVTFSDGTPFDAAAVKQGIERNQENSQIGGLDAIESIDVIDPLTVVFNLDDDTGSQLPHTFILRDGMIMAPGTEDSAAKNPVGAGPFTFDSFSPGSDITLTRNDSYWDADSYDFGGITFTQTATGPPSVSALRAGDVDLIRFEAESFEALENNPKVDVVVQSTTAYLQIQFRTKEGSPFTDPLVRQAVRFAIDTDELNEIVNAGLGEVATQPLPVSAPGYNPDVADHYPFDPDRARELLAEAGLADGFEFTMVIPGGNIANMERQGALIQDQLAKVGITANIERILGTDIATQYYIAGKGDAFAAARLGSTFGPIAYNDQWGEDQFVAIWNGAENAEITRLMVEASATTDPEVREAKLREAAAITTSEALEVPIAFMPQFMAYDNDRVGGTIGGQPDICIQPNLSELVLQDGS